MERSWSFVTHAESTDLDHVVRLSRLDARSRRPVPGCPLSRCTFVVEGREATLQRRRS
jgi:hypothetical protein